MARTKAQVAADNKRTAAEKKRKEIAALEDSPAKEKDRAKKRKIKNDYKDNEDEEVEDTEELSGDDSELDKKRSELKNIEKKLKLKMKELEKIEDLKAKPAKKGRKKADAQDEEKVDVISIQYKVEIGRPNDELNDTFATAIIDDFIGFGVNFIEEDVSILFYLIDFNSSSIIITFSKLKKDFKVKLIVNGSLTHAVIDDPYIWKVNKSEVRYLKKIYLVNSYS